MDDQQHRRRRRQAMPPVIPAAPSASDAPARDAFPQTPSAPIKRDADTKPSSKAAQPPRKSAASKPSRSSSAPRPRSKQAPKKAKPSESASRLKPPSEASERPARRRRRPAEQQNAAPVQDELFWHPESALLDAQPEAEKPTAKEKAHPFQFISAIDACICRIGDGMLDLLKWISIGFLYLAGFVSNKWKNGLDYIDRLRGTKHKPRKRTAVHTGRRLPRKKSASQNADFTLEPTRPEAYQGMGEKRAGTQKRKKRVVRAPEKRFSLAYSALMAALICVALVSTTMIVSILWRSISTTRLNNALSARYSELSETQKDDIPQIQFAQTSPPIENTPVPAEAPALIPQATPTPQPKDAVRTTKFHQLGGDALPEMAALYKENRDLVGWLRMEGILDLPVVYRDNDYYLTRDFYKNKSASGTLFLDENHPFRENAQNLLLHGHNMKDGTMFGRLVQYETNLQFLKNNPFIQYSTLWQKEQYVICAVLHVSLDVRSDQFFNYFTHHTFASDAQFENYVRLLQNRSIFSIPVDIEPTDALLTLSTCLDEDRLVIVARRVRPGESKSELRHQVQLAARQ